MGDEDELEGAGASGGAKSTASSSRPTKATKRKLEAFDVADYLDTHPALLGSTSSSNRLRRRQLETAKLTDQGKLERGEKAAYKELFHRQERAKRLTKVREALELKTNVHGKGQVRKMKEATADAPAQYRWLSE